jgi:hypothetical protein
VAISIPLHELDRNVFMSYNFEANYNELNQPQDSFPGPPFTRWKLGSTYVDMSVNPAGDASPDDAIARDLKEIQVNGTKDETTTTVKSEITTAAAAAATNELKEKRSLPNSMFTTRKGIYRVIESRLKA